MSGEEELRKAEAVARERHAGQVDKGGHPYIDHPKRVASIVPTDLEKTVAWLHDTVEDTGYTEVMMRSDGFSDEVVEAVMAITHRPHEPYMEYIDRVFRNRVARSVKISDIIDNMDMSRLSEAERRSADSDRRMNKYVRAIRRLFAECERERADRETDERRGDGMGDGGPIRFPAMIAFSDETLGTGEYGNPKDVPLKVLEESAELVEASKRWMRSKDAADRADMLYELSDVIQALTNLCAKFGISYYEMCGAASRCIKNNLDRGRYGVMKRDDLLRRYDDNEEERHG